MQTERSDRLVTKKLEILDTLPAGFQFDSQLAWKNIEKNLHPVKRKMFPWQYAAAAIILMAGTASALFLSHPQKHPVQPPATVANNKMPADILTGVKKTTEEKHKKTTLEKTHDQSRIADIAKIVDTPNDSVSQITIPIAGQPKIAIPLLPAPMIATAAVKDPLKKKLKVIHFNELQNEPELPSLKLPQKRLQAMEDVTEDETPAHTARPWWQPKPKIVTISTLSDNN